MDEQELQELNKQMWDSLEEPSNQVIMRVFRALQLATQGEGLIVTEDTFRRRLFCALWSCLTIHWSNNTLRRENQNLRRDLNRIVNQAETLRANLDIFVEFAQKEGISR